MNATTSAVDLAVIGGGPAGLAAAIEARRRGLSVRVLERHATPPDKACGEGLMPEGLRALEALGVPRSTFLDRSAPFAGIRYVQEDGRRVEGRFRNGPGLGIRRLVLIEELTRVAREAGAVVLHGSSVKQVRPEGERLRVETEEPLSARLVVAADGLASPLRKAAQLEAPSPGPRRFGLRQHFRGVKAPDMVEVHWADGVEAYVTPVGPDRIGLAFLFADHPEAERPSLQTLLRRFPLLQSLVDGAQPDSEVRGAGPLARAVRGVVSGRLVLLGDSAGYVDAITGEGLSLAFASAAALGAVLPRALDEPEALESYARAHAALFRPYQRAAESLLVLSAHPWLRRTVLNAAVRVPPLFGAALSLFS
jgi:flavin-dependent dehydrogenase